MNKTTKVTTVKDNVKGSNSPVTREIPTVAAESLVSHLNATERTATPAKSFHHKKKETAEEHKDREADEATSKSSKTKAAKDLSEADQGLLGS